MSEPDPTDDASTWRPVVADPDRCARIRTVLDEVAVAVSAWPIEPTLLEPVADRAVLRAYLAQDGAVPDDADDAGAMLAELVTRFGRGGFTAGLFGGAARVTWTVAHLAGGDEADEVCRAITAAMLHRLDEEPWRGDYDLISGLVGMGVAGLERIEHDDGRRLLTRVLEVLEASAQPIGGGVAWFTATELLPEWQRKQAPEGYYNLGLAHGNPGVAALLARLVAHDLEAPRAGALLARSMTYLLGAAALRPEGRYPAWHTVGGASDAGTTRLAWCYGDLGASVALMAAAQATGDLGWRAEALDLARLCASRGFDDAHVFDAGLCHGAAGAAQIFNRFWHATGEPVFGDAARAWIDHVLRMRNEEPVAGFPTATRDEAKVGGWQPSTDLLTGASGVALVLHAAISTVEPSWDHLLLMDLASS